MLAVPFLGVVVGWDGIRDLPGFGTGVALAIAALACYLSTAESDEGKAGR